jgi:hypothetical protein
MRFEVIISQEDLDNCMEPESPESAAALIEHALNDEFCTDEFSVTYLDGEV